MCESSMITKLVSLIYSLVIFGLPLLYLLTYLKKAQKSKRKNKHYGKGIVITLILFALLFGIKMIAKLMEDSCLNCYINNVCEIENEDVNNMDKDTTTSTTVKTSSKATTTTTIKATTTTTKKVEDTTTTTEAKTGNKVSKGKTSKGFEIYEIDGVTYIDGYLIANKSYFVPKDFVPTNPYQKASATATKQCANCIDKDAYKAWNEMKADATALGLNIWIQSGFRSYVLQSKLYNNYVNRDGKEKADTYSARPGSSEHQTGLCFDLNTITDAFANTAEGKWVNDNAYKYGFIIRYPKGKSDETGYKYESWHLRYVGKDLAKKLYNNGDWITMESYFGITSKYK